MVAVYGGCGKPGYRYYDLSNVNPDKGMIIRDNGGNVPDDFVYEIITKRYFRTSIN